MFGIHHVALSVKDLDRSKQFYLLLGFKVVLDWTSDSGDLKISHMMLNSFILELFCYFDSKNNEKVSLEEDLHKNGIKHFGLRVDSLDVAKERIVASGLAQEEDIQIKHGRTGIHYFFIKDPDDVFVEIVQDNRTFDI